MSIEEPPWLAIARAERGVCPPAARVDEYLATVGLAAGAGHAWCSGFLAWTLARCGIRGTGSGLARSWITWGTASPERIGAIAVLWREDPASWKGHVSFLVESTPDAIILLGGNQDDRVCEKAYPRSQLLALRWPSLTSR